MEILTFDIRAQLLGITNNRSYFIFKIWGFVGSPRNQTQIPKGKKFWVFNKSYSSIENIGFKMRNTVPNPI